MNLLHVVGSLDSSHGGPSRSVPQLAGALARRGVRCAILHAGSSIVPCEVGEAEKEGVVVTAARDTSEAIRYARELMAGGLDLVHLHGIWNPMLHVVHREAGGLKIPVVVSTRGMLEPWTLRHRRWRKAVAWHLYQRRDLERSSLLHATSQQEAEHLRELGFDRLTIIPNGVPISESSAQFGATPRIVFLSRIHAKKGLLMLVSAVASLQASLREGGWTIVVAGPDEGGHLREVVESARQHAVVDLFEFRGEIDGSEKNALLASAHLFVLPSFSENFGIVIAEALAAGVPVLTTTGTPWREIEEHDCGWWVPARPGSVTDALNEAIHADRESLRRMGTRGRELMATRYSWDSVAEQFTHAYERLRS